MSATEASPIRDVSYRNYDGPLRRRLRWWIVALAGIRIAVSRWYFWLFVALALLPYISGGLVIFLQEARRADIEQMRAQLVMMGGPDAAAQIPPIPLYAVHFYQAGAGIKWLLGFGGQSWYVLGLALAVGSASIAADTRANALLVYLSKPLTRIDYLAGKWISIFLLLYLVSVVPAVLLYLFCLVSYMSTAPFKAEPFLIAQVVTAAAVPAILHASLLLGCSACSRSGRIAGAAYAGLYFLANAIVAMLWQALYHGHPTQGVLLRSFSVQGMIEGLQQAIYHVTFPLPGFNRRAMTAQVLELVAPDPRIIGPAALAVCAVAIYIAWTRIRAIEVVTG